MGENAKVTMEFTERRWFYQVWRLLLLPVCRDSRRYSSIPDQLLRVSAEKNVKRAAMESFVSQNPRQDNGLPLALHIYRCHGRAAILTCGIHNTMTCRDRNMAIIYEQMRVYKQSTFSWSINLFFAYQLNEFVVHKTFRVRYSQIIFLRWSA